MSRLGRVYAFRRIPPKRSIRAGFQPRPCIQAEHGDIAAEARCLQHACSQAVLERPHSDDVRARELRFASQSVASAPQAQGGEVDAVDGLVHLHPLRAEKKSRLAFVPIMAEGWGGRTFRWRRHGSLTNAPPRPAAVLGPPSARASVIDTAAAPGDGDLATCTAALTVGNTRSRPSTASRPLVRAKARTGERTSAAGRV
jgi:hypothetical protein